MAMQPQPWVELVGPASPGLGLNIIGKPSCDEVVSRLGSMEVRPELLRAIYAFRGLGFGQALRSKKLKDLYKLSFMTSHIDEFWSHSWQLHSARKILTLLILKNGNAAGIVATLAALLGFVLSFYTLPASRTYLVSCWAQLFGAFAFLLSLLFWPQRQTVFLDSCCIDQSSAESKAEGIWSMGGILKKSKRMLVLWDHTFVERLWCMFELAAFLKSHEKAAIAIRPTLLGPCSLTLFSSLSVAMVLLSLLINSRFYSYDLLALLALAMLPTFYGTVVVFRKYCMSLQTLRSQLESFTVATTQCHCCSVGHEEAGMPILCDRKIVEECIQQWFGGEEAFTAMARSALLKAFADQLGYHLFPIRLLLLATSPVLWGVLDQSAAIARVGGSHTMWWLISGLGFWLGCIPICAVFSLFIANKLRQPRNPWWDWMINLLVMFLMLPVFWLTFGLSLMLEHQDFEQKWIPATIFSSIMISTACVVWNLPWCWSSAWPFSYAQLTEPSL